MIATWPSPCRNADCFIDRCPESFVPPWDFDVPPGPDRIDDSSAAAIAASGLWDLAAVLDSREPARAARYRDATLAILDTLCTEQYLARHTPAWEGVLKHGVYHFHKKLGVDESVMWGDFFFLEALDKVLRQANCSRPTQFSRRDAWTEHDSRLSRLMSRSCPATCYTMARARKGEAKRLEWLKQQGH